MRDVQGSGKDALVSYFVVCRGRYSSVVTQPGDVVPICGYGVQVLKAAEFGGEFGARFFVG